MKLPSLGILGSALVLISISPAQAAKTSPADAIREELKNSDCSYRKDGKKVGVADQFRILALQDDARAKPTYVCTGMIYCTSRKSRLTFDLPVAWPAPGPTQCGDPVAGALSEKASVSGLYEHRSDDPAILAKEPVSDSTPGKTKAESP